MENLEASPKKLPLILILIGTTILAFPAAVGTIALFDEFSPGVGTMNSSGQILFCISVGGFLLFAGYILTALLRRHNCVFWFCSMLYNFGLSGCYVYLFVTVLPDSNINLSEILFDDLINPYLLVPLWTIFVTIASGYYFRFAISHQKLSLV